MNAQDISLGDLQAMHQTLWDQRGYHALPATLALGIVEEAGEIAQAILLTECPDFVPSPRKLTDEFAEIRDVGSEVGDLISYCLHLCNSLGIVPKFKKLDKLLTD